MAAVAALSVITSTMESARQLPPPIDLVERAKRTVNELIQRTRIRPKLTAPGVVALNFDAAENFYRAEPNPEGMKKALAEVAKSIDGGFAAATKARNDELSALQRYLNVQDEELDMLWWLVGHRSWDLDCGFEKVPAESRPLVFAKELAGVTSLLPGPAQIKSLLSRAGLDDEKKLSVPDAVGALKAEWLRGLPKSHTASPVLNPLHFAIERSLEVGGGVSWIPGWSAATELDAKTNFSPLALGTLFYYERLLMTDVGG
jgi:hypothetical protein